MNRKGGFTLIELLVVIAIIGILSSVVLASLNSARTKGADAAIKSGLSNFMSQAEVLYASGSQFTETLPYGAARAGTCPAVAAATDIFDYSVSFNILKNVAGNANVAVNATTMKCFSDGSSYALQAPLRTSGAGSWCVDSTGFVGKGTATANKCTAS